jgi:putative resolvase
MRSVTLSEWADRAGVSKFTAYRWFHEGTLLVPARRVGRLVLVGVNPGGRSRQDGRLCRGSQPRPALRP